MNLQDPLAFLWPCLAALALAAANGPLDAGDLTLAMEGQERLKAANVGIQGNPQFVEGKTGKAVQLTKGSFLTLPSRGVFDAGKGSVAMWVRPEWNGDDGQRHTFFHLGSGDTHFTIFKTEGGTLRFVYKRDPQHFAAIDLPVRGWNAGEWHQVTASWTPSDEDLALVLKVDDATGYRLDAKPLAATPAAIFIGSRGPAFEPAEAAIDEVLITDRLLLTPPIPLGEKGKLVAEIDAAATVGPLRRIHDFTTIWNSRETPLPFKKGDAYYRRFQEAGFKLARLIAFSDTWLWGIHVQSPTRHSFGDGARGADGKLALDFTDFDDLVDTVTSAGAAPYIRLAYNMPKALSSAAEGGRAKDWAYAPPKKLDEWDELMRRIVTHGVERKLGVKYYVTALNEGDLSAQRGTADWATVCQLYERTSRIVKEIDPTAKVGGPALAHDPRTSGEPFMRSFLKFCRERKLPLDFICYHAYRKPLPQDYEALVKHVQKLVAEEYPEAKPEHFLDEFNLWHTDAKQDNEYGAAYLAASLHFQRRAGVEKSCIISFNHFLPVSQPPSVIASHRGPFDKTASQTARFLAAELDASGVKKRGILAHPPGNRDAYTFGRYQVTVPQAEKPRLTFSTGLAIKPYPQMDGAVFEVLLARDGEPRTLFKHPQRAIPWQAHTVALDEWRGQQVSIEFRTNCGKTAVADWAAWGEPKLMVGDKAVFDFAESIASAETGVYSPGYRFIYNDEVIQRYGGLPLLKGPVVTAPYFVYQLHSLLKKNQLALSLDGDGGIAKDHCAGLVPSADESGLAILAWTFDLGSKKPRSFEIALKSLPKGKPLRLRQYLIDSTHTNPYYDYVLARKPDNDGRYNLEDGNLAVVRDETVAVDATGRVRLAFSLESKAVSLFELRPTR